MLSHTRNLQEQLLELLDILPNLIILVLNSSKLGPSLIFRNLGIELFLEFLLNTFKVLI